MVRSKLQVSPAVLPKEQLQALWRALDVEGRGLIGRGVFGAFMRKGSGDDATSVSSSPAWKAKLAQRKAAGDRLTLVLESVFAAST